MQRSGDDVHGASRILHFEENGGGHQATPLRGISQQQPYVDINQLDAGVSQQGTPWRTDVDQHETPQRANMGQHETPTLAGIYQYETPRHRGGVNQHGTPQRADVDQYETPRLASGYQHETPRHGSGHWQATPRRTTPAKRNASASPTRAVSQSSRPPVPRRPADSSPTQIACATARAGGEVTPRRLSARIRAEGYSPVMPVGIGHGTSTPSAARSSPRQPSPSRGRAQVKQGRPPSQTWEHFEELRIGGKRIAACKYCLFNLNNPKPGGNMSTHLLRICKEIPMDVKLKLSESTGVPAPSYLPATYTETHEPPSEQPAAPSIDQATFNLMIVELVVVCALPFSILESLAFKHFIHQLAPTVKVPPRQFLTKAMRRRVVAKINLQSFVSIVTDGWTDPNGAKIVNFMVVAPGMPSLFWSSWASGSEAHSSANLTAKVREVVEEVERLTSARVVGIVTDNASNMTGMWSRLSQLAIVGGGCAAHVLDLLMKNLFAHEALKKVHSNCVQLSRFVRDHTALVDTFRVTLKDLRAAGEKRNGLTLPVPTRWYSVFNCLENVLVNREELLWQSGSAKLKEHSDCC